MHSHADDRRRRGPQPGDLYREFAVHNGGHAAWRVTDPEAKAAGAQRHLPNPVAGLHVGDLDGAIRAEALLDRWGGHLRTTDKRIRFNRNEWIPVPEIETVPAGRRAEMFYSQDNPVVEVPLGHLNEGVNAVEATCSALENYGWGQWGLYSVILRVYYDPEARPHATGRIVEPADGGSIAEHPSIRIEPDPGRDVARIDVLAWYEGYDENGDGRFRDWHAAWFQPHRGAPAELREHVGTLWRAPYELTWDTRWIPDQPARSIKLIARIQSGTGVWYTTQPVENLTLARQATSVRMYRAADVPEAFGVRAGREKSCMLNVPDGKLDSAAQAVLAIRTWHGWDDHHHPLMLNGRSFRIGGKNHHYDYDLLPVPLDALKSGDNVFTVRSDTEHHMLEVLWPGPALIVRYRE